MILYGLGLLAALCGGMFLASLGAIAKRADERAELRDLLFELHLLRSVARVDGLLDEIQRDMRGTRLSGGGHLPTEDFLDLERERRMLLALHRRIPHPALSDSEAA